jgi:hypothetical protein
MNLDDVRNVSKDDVLDTLSIASKYSVTEVLGIFGLGLLVGAGAALLLASKSGQELREDVGHRLRELRDRHFAQNDKDSEDEYLGDYSVGTYLSDVRT